MTLKGDAKFKEQVTGCLENDMRKLENFHQSNQKCQNWNFDGILFAQSRKCMTLKFTEELCIMTVKSYTKN